MLVFQVYYIVHLGIEWLLCMVTCIYDKWKNHFYEMKGDVGMSLHEKERNKKMPTQDTKSLITPSLHLCFALTLFAMNALGKANSTTS